MQENDLKPLNQEFFNRIKDTVEASTASIRQSVKSKEFRRADSYFYEIALAVAYRPEASGVLSNIPPDFEYPMCHFVKWERQETTGPTPLLYTTRYGRLPIHILSPEGLLYLVTNAYYFDHLQKAVKVESIASVVIPFTDAELLLNEKEGRLKRVDFTPPIFDVRYVSLEAGDYEIIGLSLEFIKSGRYI